jgi:hypothetical protein
VRLIVRRREMRAIRSANGRYVRARKTSHTFKKKDSLLRSCN